MFIGQMTLEKLTSVSATARPKYILLLYILFHFPSSNIALHCTALDYLSSVLNSILNGHKTHLDTFSKNTRIVVKIFNCGNHIFKRIHFMLYLWATTPFYLPIIIYSQVLATGSRSNTFKATEVKRNIMSGKD